MDGMICTQNFIDFYMKLSNETSTLNEYFEIMKEAANISAQKLQLGRCLIIVNSPASGLVFEQIQDRNEIYLDKNGYNAEGGLRQTFVTDDWGVVQIELYPLKDVFWKDENVRELEFIIQVLFDCLSKMRTGIIMKQATITDHLTGACNSTGIINYVTEMKNINKLFTYNSIFFNIKNFNYINNRFGNREGDKILKELSRQTREFLKKGELFGRVSGDSFFILIEKERTDKAIEFLTSRRVLVELDTKNIELDLMIRMGIYDNKEEDSAMRVLEATKAAYNYTRNPSAGDLVYFREEMLMASAHDEEVSNNFLKALRKEQFVVYYQPKVDLKNSRLMSAEALCRWVVDGKVVPPMDFIPVLERDGSISHLDFYMLNKVCEHIVEWKNKGLEPVKVSVNFSRANFLNKKLAIRIIKLIESYNVEPEYIEIEITEMSGYEDFEALSEFVNTMKAANIEISLDDFGTGYSSLNLIKDLNVDTIKLDKSFLNKIDMDNSNSQGKSVIKNIIKMVNELNMNVVAEGVETLDQMEFLKEVNCQGAQGFLFDRPMPKSEFELKLMGERVY